jgi:hypothetical protein
VKEHGAKSTPRAGWLKYALTAAVGAAIAVPVAVLRGLTPGLPAHLTARYLSDGFFVAGLMLVGIGALSLVATTGFFDILAYGFRSLLVLFTPFKKPDGYDSYYDYKIDKDARRGKPTLALLLVGMAFLLAAVLCLALYYRWMV